MNFDVEENTIFLVRSGSHAYGTTIATSDEDFKGVAVSPKEYVLGPFFNFEQQEELVSKGNHVDKVVFDLLKFVKLAAACNPNMIEVLFTDSADYVVCDELGQLLVEHRDLFLSKQVKWRFMGYAASQLKRIRGHRSWLLNPPGKKPERVDFGLPEVGNKVISGSTMGAVDELRAHDYKFGSEVMQTIDAEKRYATALKHWKQYEGWKKSRNEVRAALEAKYGYDTKHGMHLIRLMRMCAEILAGKGVLVRRPDAEELISIRNGSKSYDELLEEAEILEAQCEALFETTSLPNTVDISKLNDLCIRVQERFWSR